MRYDSINDGFVISIGVILCRVLELLILWKARF